MNIKLIFGLGWAVLFFMLGACAPMKMGVQQTALTQLLEAQTKCSQLRQNNFGGLAGDQKKMMLVKCENTESALEMAAKEYADEAAKVGISPANRVYWYRLAATAGWQSHREAGMADAVTYADEGAQICRAEKGIQPGDCAVMYMIGGFVANDKIILQFDDLNRTAEASAAGTSPQARTMARQKIFLKLNKERGLTALEDMAKLLLRNGWHGLDDAWEEICEIRGFHEDVAGVLTAQQESIAANLKKLHDRAVNLPLVPENTTWLKANLCKDGRINDEAAGDLQLAPAGTDFAGLTEPEQKQAMMRRAMLQTYCAWQFADRETKRRAEMKCDKAP